MTQDCAYLIGESSCDYHGHLVAARDGDRLLILEAEPRVLFSGAILAELLAGNGHPDVQLVAPNRPSMTDAVLTVRAVNRTAVYRIGDRVAWDREHPGSSSLVKADRWPAEWPD